MIDLLASLLLVQAAPDASEPHARADYECRFLEFRQEVRCDLDLTIPPQAGDRDTVVKYECVFVRHRLSGRCLPRSALPADAETRTLVENIVRVTENNQDLYRTLSTASGERVRFTARIPLNVPAPPIVGEPME